MTQFVALLLRWYQQNARDLPWRRTADPYSVWLSEVILQQTRVDQGLAYYLRFLAHYPTVTHLAAAPPDEVMLLWQGLGYYSRARNMHATAREIVDRHGGVFPKTAAELSRLKGIGAYTSAAVASFCFHEPVPVVDGNVYRFLSRFFAIDLPIDSSEGKKFFYQLASDLMDGTRPGMFNQAMMEFGSMQCAPRNPLCFSCPFQVECKSYQTGNTAGFPVKSRKVVKRTRYLHFLVSRSANGKTIIEQRSGKDIWHSLYQFPLEESCGELLEDELMQLLAQKGIAANGLTLNYQARHLLTHQVIEARFWVFNHRGALPDGWIMVDWNQLHEFAFPQLIKRALPYLSRF